MNSKLAVVVVALVLVVVLGPSGSQGVCLNNFCDPNPLSAGSIACRSACQNAGYNNGICTAGTDPLTSTCTCDGDNGDPTVPLMDTICQNAFCEADCTSCGYAHHSCDALETGVGRRCTCSN